MESTPCELLLQLPRLRGSLLLTQLPLDPRAVVVVVAAATVDVVVVAVAAITTDAAPDKAGDVRPRWLL